MNTSFIYKFFRLFWSIYFILTISVIGFIFGYLFTFAIYACSWLLKPWPSISEKVRHLAENFQCLSIRMLLKIQPWFQSETNLPNTIGFYNHFKTRKILFVANHRSNLDTFLLISYIPGLAGLAKSSLFYNIFFAPFMYVSGFIPVDKGSPSSFVQGLKLMSLNLMQKNRSVLIFPETTRCEKGFNSVQKFAASFFNMAIENKSLVVPLAIQDTDLLMGRGDCLLHPYHNVKISMLPPIDASQFTDAMQLRNLVWSQMKEQLT